MPALSFARAFFWSQLFVTPPKAQHDFSGQTIVVTGANVGIGLEAARQFAELGCSKLILAVRTISKGEAAKASIQESTKRTDDFIEVWELDMSSTASVKDFARRVNALQRLDVLTANAGIALTYWKEMEGMEQNIKVNVVSTCLLALLVLPKLRETADTFAITPRLVITTSEAHKVTKFEDGMNDDFFAKFIDSNWYEKHRTETYPISKLLQIFFVRELIKHVDDRVIVTSVTPGLAHSELANRTPLKFEYWMAQLLKFLLARKTEVGARIIVASACVGREGHGAYMEDCKVVEPDVWMSDDEKDMVQTKSYDQILAYLETQVPGVSKNI